MASISADTFTVNTSRGQNGAAILYDHSRKYRTRKFYLYDFLHMDEPNVMAAKDFGRGKPVYLPSKMAQALWHAHQDWLKTQRPRS